MGAISGVYTVRRKFIAGGKEYTPGQEWEPSGAKHERKLISCGYVVFEPLREDKTRAIRREKKVKDAS